MDMTARSITTVPPRHTKAWLTFEENLDSVSHMVSLARREVAQAKAETKRFSAYLKQPRDLAKKAELAVLVRRAERFAKTYRSRVDRLLTTTAWQVVMLVTCVEAYLQDMLSIAASVDATLMSKSEQVAPYADVIASASLEELANELRARWARGWLSDGGPSRWISRLKKMGARGFPVGLASRLELMWGIRHVVVHAAGVATRDFIKRHPGVVAKAGDRVRVNIRTFGTFLGDVQGFVDPMEAFFLARYPSLGTAPPTGATK